MLRKRSQSQEYVLCDPTDVSISTDKYSTRKEGLVNGDRNQNSGCLQWLETEWHGGNVPNLDCDVGHRAVLHLRYVHLNERGKQGSAGPQIGSLELEHHQSSS